MRDDLVERLRALAHDVGFEDCATLLRSAAEEIERLHIEVTALRLGRGTPDDAVNPPAGPDLP